jgi:5S rRNA maturation endonuclease (ribonuclease M5)
LEPTHSKSWLLQIVKALEISREINIQGLPILVEGKRDKDILLKLGFSGPIEILNRGWDLDKLVVYLLEKYDNSNTLKVPIIALLMDWDRTGGSLQRKLRNNFLSMDRTVDEKLRKELIRLLNGRTKTVEGMKFILDELITLMKN